MIVAKLTSLLVIVVTILATSASTQGITIFNKFDTAPSFPFRGRNYGEALIKLFIIPQ